MALEWDKAPADWFDHAENDDAINEHAFNQFLFWEAATHDTIDFKKVYVDIAGDLNAGLALSEIVYWYLPNKDKKSKLRVKKEGKHWIACQRHEWWDRTRMSPKQIDRALDILLKHGLIEKKRFRFNGEVTVHVRLVHNTFMRQLNAMIVSPPENPFLPKGKTDFDQRVKSELPKGEIPLTESTTETTAENKDIVPDGTGETPKPKTLDQEMFDAITEVWKTAPGFTGKLRKFLQAKYIPSGNSKNDKRDADWIENNLDKPLDAAEVRAFGAWYADSGDAALPEKPEKIANWVHRFRIADDYRMYMSQMGVVIDSPDEPPPQVTHTREALGLPPMPDVDYVAIANMTPAQRQQQIDALLDELDRTKGLSYVSQ